MIFWSFEGKLSAKKGGREMQKGKCSFRIAVFFLVMACFFLGACTALRQPFSDESQFACVDHIQVKIDGQVASYSFEDSLVDIPIPPHSKVIDLVVAEQPLASICIREIDDFYLIEGNGERLARGQYKVFSPARRTFIVALADQKLVVQDYKNHHRFSTQANSPRWVKVTSGDKVYEGPFKDYIFATKNPEKTFRVEVDEVFLGSFVYEDGLLQVVNVPFIRMAINALLVDHFGEKYVVSASEKGLVVMNYKNCSPRSASGTTVFKRHDSGLFKELRSVEVCCVVTKGVCDISGVKSLLVELGKKGWERKANLGRNDHDFEVGMSIFLYTDGFYRVVFGCETCYEGYSRSEGNQNHRKNFRRLSVKTRTKPSPW